MICDPGGKNNVSFNKCTPNSFRFSNKKTTCLGDVVLIKLNRHILPFDVLLVELNLFRLHRNLRDQEEGEASFPWILVE